MKLPTNYPPIDLSTDGSNLRAVLHNISDMFRRIVLAFNTPDNGVTANRPTLDLAVGQQFFDTTLGIPIWWNGADWIDAAGTVV